MIDKLILKIIKRMLEGNIDRFLILDVIDAALASVESEDKKNDVEQ